MPVSRSASTARRPRPSPRGPVAAVLVALLVSLLASLVAVPAGATATRSSRLDASVPAASVRTAVAGDTFYDVPSPLPLGQPGDLIKDEVIAAPAGLAGTVHRVMYHSRSLTGADIAETGLIAVPMATKPAGGYPVISWAHGTTGSADVCAPSTVAVRGYFFDVSTPLVAAGYLVAGTDYEGLGTPGPHPYLVGESAGRSVLDIVRAARNLAGSPASSRFAIWGHSQGGHAAIWANQLAATWAPELTDVGAIALAPASHLTALWDLNQAFGSTTWAYLVMLLNGLHATHPDAPLSRVFTPAGLAKVGVTETGCEGAVNAAFAGHDGVFWFGRTPVADRVYGPLLRDSEPGQIPTSTPLLVDQGLQDSTVPPGATGAMVSDACALGSVIHKQEYPTADHDSIPDQSLAANLAWTAARFAGTKATNDCPARTGTAAARRFALALSADVLGRAPSGSELSATVRGLGTAGDPAGGAAAATARGAAARAEGTSAEGVGLAVDQRYLALTGTHGDDAGVAWWTWQIVAGQRTFSDLTVALVAASAPGATPSAWVTAAYEAVLHRSPDPAGLAAWAAAVASGSRTGVARALVTSTEGRVARAAEVYASVFGRSADPVARAYWGGRIATEGEIGVRVALLASGEYAARAGGRFPAS